MTIYNPDTPIDILKALETLRYAQAIDDYSLFETTYPTLDENDEQDQRESFITHLRWMQDWRFITVANKTVSMDSLHEAYHVITMTGHGVAYLEQFRNEAFFNQVKNKAAEHGWGLMPKALDIAAHVLMNAVMKGAAG